MANWYDAPVTHGYITQFQGFGTDTPHYAEDLGTPFHTPLTAPTSGTVVRADYQPWGGEIFVQPDNHSLPEWYMYHPDVVEVHSGQHVNAGQEIALSGGELPGEFAGAQHPVQNDASHTWSTGPHTHVGWFQHWITPPETGGTIPYGPDPTNLLEMARSGGAGGGSNSPQFPIPSDIYNAVEPIASNAHVPDSIWETVAYVESTFNPQATGDNGTSFGLFQLHQGGQLTSTAAQAFDPANNARQAMPAISSAWNSLGGSFDPGSTSWWQKFAAQSGHPGGAPGDPVTDSEAAKLQQAYQQYANGSALSGPFGLPTPGDIGAAISGGVDSFFNKINASIGGLLLRTGVGIAGVGLVWIGAMDIVAALRGESIYQMQQDSLQAIPGIGEKASAGYETLHRAAFGSKATKSSRKRKSSGGKKKKSTSSSAKPKQESKPKTESTPAPKEATAAESGAADATGAEAAVAAI